jgi:hypothetical protein
MSGDKKVTMNRPNGWLQTTDFDGKVREADTWQCKHCGAHHVVHKGSGRLRAFCIECNALICPGCAGRVPLEQYLENLEAGMADEVAMYHRPPVKVSVPAGVPKIILGR